MKTPINRRIYENIKRKLHIMFYYFYIFLNIICLFRIAIQEAIIILNALFKKKVDAFAFKVHKTPKINNSDENIKIVSYRQIPEIYAALFARSIGLIIHKKCGFYFFIIVRKVFQIISFLTFFVITLSF